MLRIVYISLVALLLQIQGMAQARLPKRLRKQLPNCCHPKALEGLPFRTDGIYLEVYEFDEAISDSIALAWSGRVRKGKALPPKKRKTDTIPQFMYMFSILYPDGTFFRTLSNFYSYDSILSDILRVGAKHEVYTARDIGGWGTYEVCGDTVFSYTASRSNNYWGSIIKLEYRVIDQIVERKGIGISGYNYKQTVFIPYPELPNAGLSWFRRQECVPCADGTTVNTGVNLD